MGLLKIFNKITTRKEESQFIDIPKDIVDILWFKDGQYKNFIENKNTQEINIGGIQHPTVQSQAL